MTAGKPASRGCCSRRGELHSPSRVGGDQAIDSEAFLDTRVGRWVVVDDFAPDRNAKASIFPLQHGGRPHMAIFDDDSGVFSTRLFSIG
jgi:hypothetical protein